MPVLSTRTISEFPLANRRLSEWCDLPGWPGGFWLARAERRLLANGNYRGLLHPQYGVLWENPAAQPAWPWLHASGSFAIKHCWDLLPAHADLLQNSSELFDDTVVAAAKHNAQTGCYVSSSWQSTPQGWQLRGKLQVGAQLNALPGVVIEGEVVIGANCKIGPNCYLRGPLSIGNNCIIGQGVELKNCIILDNSCVAHLSYFGDSILGSNVNIGGGTISSNFRHDAGTHRILVQGVLQDSGLSKLGCVIGDNSRIGINNSIYPARTLPAGTRSLPGAILR